MDDKIKELKDILWELDNNHNVSVTQTQENINEATRKIVKLFAIPIVSHRTFNPNDTEVEDMAVQIDQFINQHALAKPGTYSRKLREFLANKLNEYGG